MVSFFIKRNASEEFLDFLNKSGFENNFITTDGQFNFIEKNFQGEIYTSQRVGLNKNILLDSKHLKSNKSDITIGIINGFGNAIGTLLQGLNSLLVLSEYLTKQHQFVNIRFNLYTLKSNTDTYFLSVLHKLTQQVNLEIKVIFLPVLHSEIFENDYLVDNSSYILDKNYLEYPIIDYFLKKYNLDFTTIQSKKNNNFLKQILYENINPTYMKQIDTLFYGKKIVLLHPLSSTKLRSMPKKNVYQIIETIITSTDYYVVSAIDFDYKQKRFMNLSQYSDDFFKFCYIISQVDKVISVGTSTYHIAAAFDKDTLVIPTVYTDIVNSKSYQNTVNYLLPNLKQSKYYFHHKNNTMTEEEIAFLWKNVELNEIINFISGA